MRPFPKGVDEGVWKMGKNFQVIRVDVWVIGEGGWVIYEGVWLIYEGVLVIGEGV